MERVSKEATRRDGDDDMKTIIEEILLGIIVLFVFSVVSLIRKLNL